MEWFRWYEGTTSDPKFMVVAKKAKQPVAFVLAVWAMLLERASSSTPRGSISEFDCESADVLLGMPDGATAAILEEMQGKGLIDNNNICKWDKRQPKREDETSTQRVRECRERKKVAESLGNETQCNDVKRNETQCNDVKRNETLEEKRRDKNIKAQEYSLRSYSSPELSAGDSGKEPGELAINSHEKLEPPEAASPGIDNAEHETTARGEADTAPHMPEKRTEEALSSTKRESMANLTRREENAPKMAFTREKPPDALEAVITLPLNTGVEHPVTQGEIEQWQDLYPAVDVLQALRSMRGWLLGNKTRRKTKNGIGRFIQHWLAKEQDSGRTRASPFMNSQAHSVQEKPVFNTEKGTMSPYGTFWESMLKDGYATPEEVAKKGYDLDDARTIFRAGKRNQGGARLEAANRNPSPDLVGNMR